MISPDQPCCLCHLPLKSRAKNLHWLLGNNAQPVMDGRCCDACDEKVVIPLRIILSVAERRHAAATTKHKHVLDHIATRRKTNG